MPPTRRRWGAVDRTVAEFGRLDVLVNNAGVGVAASIDDILLADYDRCFAVNVRAVFVAIQAAARHMGRGGRIITIGSVNGDRPPVRGGAIYAATKAAVAGLTRGAARDLGARGITVNVVQPGPIDTDIKSGRRTLFSIRSGGVGGGALRRAAGRRRDGCFPGQPEAAFITGASLNVDGGYNA